MSALVLFLRASPALDAEAASIPSQQLCAQLHFQQVSLKRVKPAKHSNEKAESSLCEGPGKPLSAEVEVVNTLTFPEHVPLLPHFAISAPTLAQGLLCAELTSDHWFEPMKTLSSKPYSELPEVLSQVGGAQPGRWN